MVLGLVDSAQDIVWGVLTRKTKMKVKRPKVKKQDELYDFFSTCTGDELKEWYVNWSGGYPLCVMPLVKTVAVYRGFDTHDWPNFYK
jgi:hypothetical protein